MQKGCSYCFNTFGANPEGESGMTEKGGLFGSPFCRNEATRTPDPYVPNVVRYQLRYIPILA